MLSLLLATSAIAVTTYAQQPASDWVKVGTAPWQPRDSQGELVYKNQLWILGGWFGSFEAPPRDVWASPDGKSWKLIEKNAPWIHSDLPMSLAYGDRMWIMGGWHNGRLPGYSALMARSLRAARDPIRPEAALVGFPLVPSAAGRT